MAVFRKAKRKADSKFKFSQASKFLIELLSL